MNETLALSDKTLPKNGGESDHWWFSKVAIWVKVFTKGFLMAMDYFYSL